MDISTEKRTLIEWIKHIQDKSLLDHLMFIKNEHTRENDWWDEISDREKLDIDAGLTDIDAGRTIAHEEVKKIYKKYQ